MNAIVKNIYDDIRELSDIEIQKDLWLGGNPNRTSSFVELMCRIFDDHKFGLFVEKEAFTYRLPPETIESMANLRDLLNTYKEKETDQKIIEDVEWQKIVNAAKDVLSRWNTL